MIKFAEFLVDNGHECHVVAAEGAFIDYFGYQDVIERLNVSYVPDALQKKTNQAHLSKKTAIRDGGKPSSWTTLLKSAVLELSTPDPGIFFINRYVKECRRLIETHKIDNVVVSTPPHSDQLAGVALKRIFGDRINLIVDYRDSWTCTSLFSKDNFLLQRINEYQEARVLRAADHAVFATEPILRKTVAKFSAVPKLREKATVVLNGFDARQIRQTLPFCSDGGPLRIGYFGAIDDKPNGYRNPEELFSAFKGLDGRIEMHIYGPADFRTDWSSVLGDRLHIHGSVPHHEAIERMREMDVLLLLHTRREGADEVITGKLFDYVLAGRPIVVVGPENMEARKIVTTNDLGFCCDIGNVANISQFLSVLADKKSAGELTSLAPEKLIHFSRQHQYRLIEGILR